MNKKDEKDKKAHLSIQLNEKLNEYLDEFVKENGLKKSRLIEELLKRYVNSKSIQFPTDEEIEKAGKENSPNDDRWRGFTKGAKWVVDYMKEYFNKK